MAVYNKGQGRRPKERTSVGALVHVHAHVALTKRNLVVDGFDRDNVLLAVSEPRGIQTSIKLSVGAICQDTGSRAAPRLGTELIETIVA